GDLHKPCRARRLATMIVDVPTTDRSHGSGNGEHTPHTPQSEKSQARAHEGQEHQYPREEGPFVSRNRHKAEERTSQAGATPASRRHAPAPSRTDGRPDRVDRARAQREKPRTPSGATRAPCRGIRDPR